MEQTVEVEIAAAIFGQTIMEYLKEWYLDKGMLFGEALEEVETYWGSHDAINS